MAGLTRDSAGTPEASKADAFARELRRERTRREVLELVLDGASLEVVLAPVVTLVESEHPGAFCCVLWRDDPQRRKFSALAPNLPPPCLDLVRLVADAVMDPGLDVLALGGLRTVVEDVREHSAWAPWQERATRVGLAACWSEPVRARDGTPVGALLVLRATAYLPQTEELALVAEMAALAGATVQHHRAHAALNRRSQAVEHSPVSIVVTDRSGAIEYVNPKFTELTGYTAADVLGCNPRVLQSGQTPRAVFVDLWQTILVGREWRGEFHNRKKNGDFFYELASITPVFDASGTITHFVAVKEDITERKQMEAELRRTNELLEARVRERTRAVAAANRELADSLTRVQQAHQRLSIQVRRMPLACIVWDADFRVSEWNPAAQHIFGWTPEEALGRHAYQLIVPEDARSQVEEVWRDVMVTGNSRNRSVSENVTKDGRQITCEWFNTPLRQPSGQIVAYLAMGHDVTERRKAELDRQRAEAALRQLNQELEQRVAARTAELERAHRARSEFLANVSHELRTPLNAVIGFSELLSSSVADAKQKSHIDAIHKAGRTLLTLINDILDLSKLEAKHMRLELGPVTLGSVFDEIQLILAERAQSKGLDLVLEIERDVPVALLLDETRIRQILLNLVGNAIKFTEHGHVRLSARARANAVTPRLFDLMLAVEDTGIGIPLEEQQSIFDPFRQQSGQSTRKYGGTGLGLTISKRLAEMFNGEIALDSAVGRGSTFTVTLFGVAAVEPNTLEHAGAPSGRERSRFRPACVLVVDDVESNRRLIEEVLSTSGLEVLGAEDGRQAVLLAEQKLPSVIIMDFRMPVVDGQEAARQLRENPLTARIPIIGLTASELGSTSDEARGFACVLTKPIMPEELLAALARLLPVDAQGNREPSRSPSRPPTGFDPIASDAALRGSLAQRVLPLLGGLKGAVRMTRVHELAWMLSELGRERGSEFLARAAERLKAAAAVYDIGLIRQELGELEKLLASEPDGAEG